MSDALFFIPVFIDGEKVIHVVQDFGLAFGGEIFPAAEIRFQADFPGVIAGPGTVGKEHVFCDIQCFGDGIQIIQENALTSDRIYASIIL